MLSKILLVLICLLGLAISQSSYTRRSFLAGTTSSWTQFSVPNGIYTDVSFASLSLTKIPSITTAVSCISYCWSVTGVSSLYNVTTSSFRVYLRYPDGSAYGNLNVATAVANNFTLSYIVVPLEWSIYPIIKKTLYFNNIANIIKEQSSFLNQYFQLSSRPINQA